MYYVRYDVSCTNNIPLFQTDTLHPFPCEQNAKGVSFRLLISTNTFPNRVLLSNKAQPGLHPLLHFAAVAVAVAVVEGIQSIPSS